jgi:hypothetical protein
MRRAKTLAMVSLEELENFRPTNTRANVPPITVKLWTAC